MYCRKLRFTWQIKCHLVIQDSLGLTGAKFVGLWYPAVKSDSLPRVHESAALSQSASTKLSHWIFNTRLTYHWVSIAGTAEQLRFTKNNVALQPCYICIMDIMVTLCNGSSFLYSADILRFSKGAIYKLMWWMSGGEWIEEFSPQMLSVVLCKLVTCILSSFLH